MAGGTWTTQNKVRPGAYINVKATGKVNATESTLGVVTIPIELDFGPEKVVVEVDGTTDLTQFGHDLSDNQLLLVREALKQSRKVLLYRVGSGIPATVEEGPVTITANYGGSRGNDITVVSNVNVNSEGAFNIETYLAGRLVDTQVAKTVQELKPNRLISFAGEGDLTAFSVGLAGGTNTKPTINDYMTYFEKVQIFDFNTMALPVADEAIKIAGASFAKRMRDDEGKKMQVVIANHSANSEAVINVKNGVILADGTTISASQATAWVAAASASAGVVKSLTYTAYDGAVDVTQRYLSSEIVSALQNGEFLFIEKRGQAVIEQDINSLVSFTNDKSQEFSKNRVLRVLDDIANNTRQAFEDNYIGKVNNDVDGRELFKSDRINYFNSLLASGAITNFEADDVIIASGESKDSIIVEVAVQPVDALEKLYMTVHVQ